MIKGKVIYRRRLLLVLLSALLTVSAGFLLFSFGRANIANAATSYSNVYGYEKNDYRFYDFYANMSTNINDDSAVITKNYQVCLSDSIADESSSQYNHLIVAYGRKDLMDYVFDRTAPTETRNESWELYLVGTISVNGAAPFMAAYRSFDNESFFSSLGNDYTASPAVLFEKLVAADQTGTFGYKSFSSSEIQYYPRYPRQIPYIELPVSFAQDNAYDVGVYYFFYYETIFSTEIRAMGYSTDSVRSELQGYVDQASRYNQDVVGAYEKALGIYKSGYTSLRINYLKLVDGHFNKYENVTKTLSIPSVYVPDKDYVYNEVLKIDYLNGRGFSGFDVVYKSTAGYLMQNNVVAEVETFGTNRIVRQANFYNYQYNSGEQIPSRVDFNITYSDYLYKDFFIRISNSGNPNDPEIEGYFDNNLVVDVYPTSVESIGKNSYLYFDYQNIFDLFNNTLHWSVYPDARNGFTLNYDPAGVQSGVSVYEEEVSGSKRLVVSFMGGYKLTGLEITGDVPIAEPVLLSCAVRYNSLNEDLSFTNKEFAIGQYYDNTVGELKVTVLNQNGPYADLIYGSLQADVLNGIEYVKPVSVTCVTDYIDLSAIFQVNYDYSTSVLVVQNNIDDNKYVFSLSDSAAEYTLKELGVDNCIPEGYRIKSFSGDRIQITKGNEDRFNELNTVFRRADTNRTSPYVITLELSDRWPIKINYLEQWKETPFAEMKEFAGEIRVADYPDLSHLTGEQISDILGQDIVVLQFLQVAIKIDTVLTKYIEESDSYCVDLTYSHLSLLTRDQSTVAEEIKVALTPFSVWCEFFGKDWSILFFNNEEHRYFDYSNDVPTDKLYGFFSYVVFKDQIYNFSDWLREQTGGGVSVLYNCQEVKGSDFYKFMRSSGALFTVAGATTGLLFGHPIAGAAVGLVANYTLTSLAEIIDDDNGTYYTYFFFLDGTTDLPWITDTGATSREDNDTPFENKAQEVAEDVSTAVSGFWNSTFGIVLKVIAIVFVGVIVLGLLVKLIRVLFSKNES